MEEIPRTIEELIAYSHSFGADIDTAHHNDPAWQAGLRLELHGDADEVTLGGPRLSEHHLSHLAIRLLIFFLELLTSPTPWLRESSPQILRAAVQAP